MDPNRNDQTPEAPHQEPVAPDPASSPNEEPSSVSTPPEDATPGAGEASPGEKAPAVEKPLDGEELESTPEPLLGAGGMGVSADTIEAQYAYFINSVGQFNPNSDGRLAIEEFSASLITRYALEPIARAANTYTFDVHQVARFQTLLQQQRVMVLTGASQVGKRTLALFLCYRLSQENGLADHIALVKPLRKGIQIDLPSVLRDPSAYDVEGRALFFSDAFGEGNQDLITYFSRLEKEDLDELKRLLTAARAYLVLTTDEQRISPFLDRFTALGIHCPYPMPDAQLLLTGLKRQIAQFVVGKEQGSEDILGKLQEQISLEDLAVRLETMPRIIQFVQLYLDGIVGDELTCQQALRRIHDLSDWFVSDLTRDFEAWTFALSLGLTQCLTESSGIPWFGLDLFRREVGQHLRQEFHLEERIETVKDFQRRIAEGPLLDWCRAEISREQGTDLVRFKHEHHHQELWNVFLKHTRQTLTLLIPLFEQMVTGEASYVARAYAARILGRIGEIDAQNVTFRLINQWATRKEFPIRAAVGHLYEGIRASQDEPYRLHCVDRLRDLSENQDPRKLWTAVAVYKLIGLEDLPLAMSEIGKVAEQRFSGAMEDTQHINKILNRIEKELEKRGPMDPDRMVSLVLHYGFFRMRLNTLFDDENDIELFFAIRYAIVVLCLQHHEPILVFRELQAWMRKDNKALASLVVLMFLQKDGIADHLERLGIRLDEGRVLGRQKPQVCNAIVFAILFKEEAVRHLAEFIVALYQGLSDFSPASRRYFRQSVLLHLKNWALNANPIPRCREAIINLWVEIGSLDATLHSALREFMDNDADFASAEDPLNDFAIAVQSRLVRVHPKKFGWE